MATSRYPAAKIALCVGHHLPALLWRNSALAPFLWNPQCAVISPGFAGDQGPRARAEEVQEESFKACCTSVRRMYMSLCHQEGAGMCAIIVYTSIMRLLAAASKLWPGRKLLPCWDWNHSSVDLLVGLRSWAASCLWSGRTEQIPHW